MVLAVRGGRPPISIVGFEILPALSQAEEASQFATAERPAHRFRTLERAAQAYARVLKLPEERAGLLAREVFRQDAQGYWSSPTDLRTLKIEPFRSYELAAQVDCPVLLMRGTASKSLDRISFLLMAGALRRGQFVELPNVGHQMMVEDPDATAEALERFLAEVQAQVRSP
jgi:pimeloyl-ACP methyl ester carboxylesterase